MLNIAFVTEQLPGALDGLGSGPGAAHHALADAGEPKGRLYGALEHAREGTERIRAIVRGLKTFSRPEDESRSPLDVREVMDSVISMLQHEISRHARLVKEYSEVPRVDANEGRLGQVFLNLLLNATQSLSDKGDNEIRVRVYLNPPHVVVEIHDTGAGIPSDTRERIF